VLRALPDALALRADLLNATRLVVVGEGVLGSEIAATARTLDIDTTIVGPLAAPMAGQLGPVVSARLGELHTERGVRLRLGAGVAEFTGDRGQITGVRLLSGEELPADVVVVAIGATPETGWLDQSGLTLDNGVVCDSYCRAAQGIYAVGDVARFHHDHLGGLIRLENRTNATEQAAAVAANLLGAERPYTPVPYFWTDQFDAKIQVHGFLPAGAEAEIVEGSLENRRFVARYHLDGRVTGVVGWNMPKQVFRMNVTIDQDKCVACGQCVVVAPEVFDQRDEDGIVLLLDANPPAEQADTVREAASVCPALVITVHE
jgi:NADPH-dependent 2,4-dienoyl-CoA reductase/sulfur reductase-like enzyme